MKKNRLLSSITALLCCIGVQQASAQITKVTLGTCVIDSLDKKCVPATLTYTYITGTVTGTVSSSDSSGLRSEH